MESNAESDIHLAKPGCFYGVYILYNLNPKHSGRIYIGFTVNPQRRIRQHNREIKGGASKTGGDKGPWVMVLITHGFQTRLAALQFEWAWQNPTKSRRLSHLLKKSRKENVFTYRLRILSEMLNSGPWNRLPLTIQWLNQDYLCHFPIDRSPPKHMPITYGKIFTAKRKMTSRSDGVAMKELKEGESCMICGLQQKDSEKFLNCIVEGCRQFSHISCLAYNFLQQSNDKETFLMPISGKCPSCHHDMLWGDILKQKKYAEAITFRDEDDDESSQEDEFGEDGLIG